VAGGKPRPQPAGHADRPGHPAFSPDGQRVATCGGLDGTIRVWNLATGEPLLCFHHQGWSRDVAFSADGRTLFSSWTGDKLYFDDAASGKTQHVVKVEDPERPKIKPDGLSLHLSADRRRLTLYNTDDDKYLEMLITVWDAATRKQLLRCRRVEDAYWSTLTADGRTRATAHAGGVEPGAPPGRVMGTGPMRLEDLATGETLLSFPALTGQTWPLTFSPDGRLLVSYTDGPLKSGQRGTMLRVWEVLSTTEVLTLETSFAMRAAVSPDGRLLAATTTQGELLVWDLFQAREHQRFQGFNSQVTSLAFSPDGRRLVSGLADTTLLVWDVRPRENPPGKLTAEDTTKAWKDLAGRDAPRAFAARAALASAPEPALALLRKHLQRAQSADPQRLRRLLTDLESEDFTVREKAQTALVDLGELAEVALRKALEDKPTLEMRRRVQYVLERLRGPVTKPELLRSLRAVAVLEDISTPEAKQLLEELAQGAAEARLTREAKAALERLTSRHGKP